MTHSLRLDSAPFGVDSDLLFCSTTSKLVSLLILLTVNTSLAGRKLDIHAVGWHNRGGVERNRDTKERAAACHTNQRVPYYQPVRKLLTKSPFRSPCIAAKQSASLCFNQAWSSLEDESRDQFLFVLLLGHSRFHGLLPSSVISDALSHQ